MYTIAKAVKRFSLLNSRALQLPLQKSTKRPDTSIWAENEPISGSAAQDSVMETFRSLLKLVKVAMDRCILQPKKTLEKFVL